MATKNHIADDRKKVRLIDANELMKFPIRIDHYDKVNGNEHFVLGIESVLEYAENLPTVNAVEVPPVNIGDTVWFIIRGKIYKAEIVLLQWCKRENRIDSEIRGEVYGYHCVGASFSDWGKTVFSTREEAEKALHPCENCFCGTYRSCEGCSYGERRTDG